MIEVRFHGRGGQGAVTAAEILAQAAIRQGLYAQAFPNFGPERRGAPVLAFLRVSKEPIRIRSKVYKPDAIVILDPTLLLSGSNPASGLKKDGKVVINSNKPVDEIKALFPGFEVGVVDATKIAREEMGITITNTTMMGSLIKATNILPLEALEEPVKDRFGAIAKKNINSYTRAFSETVMTQ
ncbi:MAG: Pyruvate synthase subunit PorC [Syntrophorhabdaceae bacterium PtaU1.Bin034]|nr:MAG: Pyruvate synthase subunit PorC [Syntrophorhabdaceae bacterium PtaU1.Bin034]